jgi:hypothetical protein
MPRLALDTFALHARLGAPIGAAELDGTWHAQTTTLPRVSLVDLPRECQRREIDVLEIRTSHLLRIDDLYLTELHGCCSASDVDLGSLILDDGRFDDLSATDSAARYEAVGHIKPWFHRAALLQARQVRLPLRRDVTEEGIEPLLESLAELTEHAQRREVRLVIAPPANTLLAAPAQRKRIDEQLKNTVGHAITLDGQADPTLLADATRATLLAAWRSRVEQLVAGATSVILPLPAESLVAPPADESSLLKVIDVLSQVLKEKRIGAPVTLTASQPGVVSEEWGTVLRARDQLRRARS